MKPSAVVDRALGCVRLDALRRPDAKTPHDKAMGRKAMSEDERRHKATDAAERVFLARGFHGSTMAEVACSAGMSKKTIYQIFASKDELLEAVLMRRLASLTRGLEPGDDDQPMEQVLARLLGQIVRFIFTPEELAFTRLMVADSLQSDAVVNILNTKEQFIGRTTLAQWLARQTSRGALQIEDPNEAAGMLVGMALGELHVRLLMKTMAPLGEVMVEQRVMRAVRLFLRAARLPE